MESNREVITGRGISFDVTVRSVLKKGCSKKNVFLLKKQITLAVSLVKVVPQKIWGF